MSHQLVARQQRVGHGILEPSPEAHQLGAMEATNAQEAAAYRLSLAPTLDRFGPLARTGIVSGVATESDSPAVDPSRHVRRELASDRGGYRVIHQLHPVRQAAHGHQ